MITNNVKIWFYILIILYQQAGSARVFHNQPKLPACAQWNDKGSTLADQTLIGRYHVNIFIDRNNTVYVVDGYTQRILIWNADDKTPRMTIILDRLFQPATLFVTIDGSIYIAHALKSIVEKRSSDGTKDTIVRNFDDNCYALFVDVDNCLYCSLEYIHQVEKQSLNIGTNISVIVAGINTKGSASNMLYNPSGIFVDINLDLYVADRENNRIQRFKSGQRNGLTVAGRTSIPSIRLYQPTAVFLDADGYLFIVDSGNDRIIGSRANGFFCIIGCSDDFRSASDQLNRPSSAVFDNYGNIFVSDEGNSRIQKFNLLTITSNRTSIIESTYSSELTENSEMFARLTNGPSNYYYEAIQVNVFESGCYSLISNSTMNTYGYIYRNYFNPLIPTGNLFVENDRSFRSNQFELIIRLQSDTEYILVVTTNDENVTETFSLLVTGPKSVSFNRINASLSIQSTYLSELTENNQIYSRTGCGLLNYYYEAIEINVTVSGYYIIRSNSPINTYGFLYKNSFDIFNLTMNSVKECDDCGYEHQFKFIVQLKINTTYVVVVTTFSRNDQGTFSVLALGPGEVTFNHISDVPQVIQSTYSSALTVNSQSYALDGCIWSDYYYEAVRVNVVTSGSYSFSSNGSTVTYGYLYTDYFNPFNQADKLLCEDFSGCGSDGDFRLTAYLQFNTTYVLVVTTHSRNKVGTFMIFTSGPDNITFNHINKSITTQSIYTSALTKNTQNYHRVCGNGKYHYETIQMNVQENGTYRFKSNSTFITYGYIYKNDFNPSNPDDTSLAHSYYSCGKYHFDFVAYLQINTTYILVVTTREPNVQGNFSIIVTGPSNISLKHIFKRHSSCAIGDQCHSFTKDIGLTLDDILHNEIRQNTILSNQSILVKISVALTMIMFVGGLINGILSLITFQNVELRQVGCGIYLLVSSITSLLTISMFTIKFWFVILTRINKSVRPSTFRGGCMFIELLLKFFLYLDTWLNACVAVERTVSVSKGVGFSKTKSQRAARWTIIILPIFVIGTIIHEPFHRDLIQYTTEIYKSTDHNTEKYDKEKHVICVTRFSRSLQDYNTGILFFHLVTPFVANLLSASYIIFGTARQRSVAQKRQNFGEHILEQLSEHKQLIISPIILLILALPRLIMALLSGCVDVSNNPWLYLSGYFISFTPSMLIFVIFVLPSKLYKKKFKESLRRWKRRIHP